MEQRESSNKVTITITIPKVLLSLVNLWPAVLVGLALLLALPKMSPVLQELPEKLVLTEADAAQKKPPLPDPAPAEDKAPVADSGRTYTDGVYKGSSRGYGGNITVQVTVAEQKISQVDVLSAPGETAEYLSRAKKVIDVVLQAQTWEVDAISGATFSSRGILGAIQNALTGETVENEAPPAQQTPSSPPKQEPFDDNAVWKDGVYIGTGQGYGGTIKVQVTVSGGKIADIEVLSHSGETDEYYNKAKAVISRIISAGTPNVDTISGATYSSTGIINAVKDALNKAASGDSSTGDSDQDQNGNGNSSDGNKKPQKDDTEDPDLSNGLVDGTYTTDVVCTDDRIFDYTIRLTMVVKNGKIQSIQAKRTEDRSDDPDMNETYLGYAVSGRKTEQARYESVISQIIAKQSTRDVDVVSGATWSSNAILRGVKKLLAQAARDASSADEKEDEEEGGNKDPEKDPEKDPANTDPDDPSGQEDETPDPEDGLEDGTYEMDAVCTDSPDDPLFDYTVHVTMEVKDNAITSLTAEITEDRSDDPSNNERYFDFAVNGRTRKAVTYPGVIAQILDRQSTADIDTVSGATWSSKTIINAVKQLLQQAAKTQTEDSDPTDPADPQGTGEDQKDPGDPSDPQGSEDDEKDPKDPSDPQGSEDDEKDPKDPSDPQGSEDDEKDPKDPSDPQGSEDDEKDPKDPSDPQGSEDDEKDPKDPSDPQGSEDDEKDPKDPSDPQGTGEDQKDPEDPSDPEDPGEEEEQNRYLDGTYSASVLCTDDPDDPFFYYTVKVTIKVSDGEIVEVRTERKDDESEDPSENETYMDYAMNGRTRKGTTYPGIPDQILDKQETSGLDAISGATYSSRALIEAAKKALSQAENPDY